MTVPVLSTARWSMKRWSKPATTVTFQSVIPAATTPDTHQSIHHAFVTMRRSDFTWISLRKRILLACSVHGASDAVGKFDPFGFRVDCE